MPRLLTQAQYARKTRYSRARINQLVKQGVIILKNRKVNPVQAEVAITANIDRSRRLRSEAKPKIGKSQQMELLPGAFNNDQQKIPSQNGFNNDQQKNPFQAGFNNDHLSSLTEARRDHELLKIKLTEVQLKIKRGELVPKTEPIKWLVALGSATKLAFQGLPKRLAPIVRLYDDEKKIELIIRREVYRIIRELEKPLHGPKSRNLDKANTK